ncbi:hypothetical protein BB561_006782 [Smittium simulii]|uniref:Uncharacterized protein n=1 Tax=Smittium simulii TaxID=133385 RepID=A0A2T9Y1I9_9FUNG|nr:hypothetical protein BB561_006782 [Smittium simulii]
MNPLNNSTLPVIGTSPPLRELLNGRANQRSQLESALRKGGAAQIRCNPGYLDANNTGKYYNGQPDYVAPPQQAEEQEISPPPPAANEAPTPGGLREVCPLIVDIQKCMNKCVDDALA